MFWAVFGLVAGPRAQEPSDGAAPPDAAIQRLLDLHLRERDTVRLVLLPTTVRTRGGRFVTGLTAEDFEVTEDSIPQELKYFAPRDAGPLSIAFLLDLSGSMRALDKLERAKAAIRTVVESLRSEDRIGLIGFADQQVMWITTFTSDREEFFIRLGVQRGYGRTALYDAVAAAPKLVSDETTGRKALVLITDGIDNNSSMSLFQAMKLARSVEVPMYTFGFSNVPRGMRPPGNQGTMLRVLEMLSEETGGVLFTVHSEKELRKSVRTMGLELRSAYVLGYFSSQTLWNGRFRRVQVETTRGGAVARTRRGYYAKP
ncbi:VWA domain-containing protein [bacterium]|nr:VWA domain-containing protein [bacterium]